MAIVDIELLEKLSDIFSEQASTLHSRSYEARGVESDIMQTMATEFDTLAERMADEAKAVSHD